MHDTKKNWFIAGTIALVWVLVVFGNARTGVAANHIVIISDLNGTHNDTANVDVSSEPPSQVSFQIFPSSGAVLLADMNAQSFATSPELFALTTAPNALVIVNTANAQVLSTAALRQQKLIMEVPPSTKTLGTAFGFPVGDLGTSAFLLVGNPNGTPAQGTVVYGPPSGTVAAQLNVPALGIQVVQLTMAQTRVGIAINNSIQVIAQLLVNGHGQEFSMSFVPPTQ